MAAKIESVKGSEEEKKIYHEVGAWLLENNLEMPLGFEFIRDFQDRANYDTKRLRNILPGGVGTGSFGL